MRSTLLALVRAVEALGAMPEGYCFCSEGRTGDDSRVHEPECADLREALAEAKLILDASGPAKPLRLSVDEAQRARGAAMHLRLLRSFPGEPDARYLADLDLIEALEGEN